MSRFLIGLALYMAVGLVVFLVIYRAALAILMMGVA